MTNQVPELSFKDIEKGDTFSINILKFYIKFRKFLLYILKFLYFRQIFINFY